MARVKVYAISTQRRTLDTIMRTRSRCLSHLSFHPIISADTFSYKTFLPYGSANALPLLCQPIAVFLDALHTKRQN